MKRLRDRDTPDLIVLFLALLVGIILGVELIVIVVTLFLQPGYDLSEAVAALTDVTNTLIAAVVGFVAGRGSPRGGDGGGGGPAV
jgi:hypothetical protein